MSTLDTAAQASFTQATAPGVIVGVRTPKGTWTAAYGFADPTTQSPMTTDMHMRIGSVTKTFTGTLIMQLAQEGKLSLSDPIEKYYPGIPNGDRITLEQLANIPCSSPATRVFVGLSEALGHKFQPLPVR